MSNRKRTSRKPGPQARLHAAIEGGTQDPRETLRELPSAARAVTVEKFLKWIPGVGEDNAARVMRGIVFNPATKLRELGQQQRARLANRITWRVPGEAAASRREG